MLFHKDIKHHNILDELVLLNSKGRELARVSRSIVYSPSELGERSNTDGFIIPARSGENYYGPLTYDKATHEPMIMLSMPMLDIRSGDVKGVLMGRIRLHRTWENAVNRSFGSGGVIFITNSDGKVLAHPDQSMIYRDTYYKAESPAGIQTGLNNRKILLESGTFQLGTQTFTVYAALPFSEVLSLSLNTLSTTAVFLLLFIIISIAVSYVVVQRIVRPIETLADTARGISAGKIGPAIQVGNSDEIGDLSGAFNAMTSKLLETIGSLKQQMAERREADEKIIQQNELLNNILNSMTHPFYVIDANNYTIKLANPAAKFSSLTEDSTCYALTHHRDSPCDSTEHPCVLQKIKETGKPVMVEHIHDDKEGNREIYEIHGYPIFDGGGEVTEVIEYNLDITERRKMEEELQVSELKNRTITTTAKDAIIMIDEKGRTSFWNPAAEEIFGYAKEEVINKELHLFILPERYLADHQKMMRIFSDTGKVPAVGQTVELTVRKKDGTEFPVELSLSAIQLKGKWNAVGIARDITRRKESEQEMLASLREKELLLREIHHRVKNNMQIISSLLSLQSILVKDKKDVEMLKDSQNRIRSMSLIHEKLYKSKNLAHINMNDYIRDLTSQIIQFYRNVSAKIALKLEAEDIWLGIDTAIPCGLIINEMVSNSLKHAFPENRKGEIRITFQKTDNDEIIMRVKDNGVGLPGDLDFRNTRTLGLQLVSTLAESQLQGKIELNRDEGTEFIIGFKEIKYEQRF
jgi:PAS domain S-box-containing protein